MHRLADGVGADRAQARTCGCRLRRCDTRSRSGRRRRRPARSRSPPAGPKPRPASGCRMRASVSSGPPGANAHHHRDRARSASPAPWRRLPADGQRQRAAANSCFLNCMDCSRQSGFSFSSEAIFFQRGTSRRHALAQHVRAGQLQRNPGGAGALDHQFVGAHGRELALEPRHDRAAAGLAGRTGRTSWPSYSPGPARRSRARPAARAGARASRRRGCGCGRRAPAPAPRWCWRTPSRCRRRRARSCPAPCRGTARAAGRCPPSDLEQFAG